MRTLNFAKRNFKELIRDPLSLIFAIILPLFLLFIFQQFNIPNDSYKLENFTPGIIVFGFSFITLFTAMLISKDRTNKTWYKSNEIIRIYFRIYVVNYTNYNYSKYIILYTCYYNGIKF